MDSRDRLRRDMLPVAQHRNAVGQREDLVEAMADVNDADALRSQLAQDAE